MRIWAQTAWMPTNHEKAPNFETLDDAYIFKVKGARIFKDFHHEITRKKRKNSVILSFSLPVIFCENMNLF